MSASVSRLPPAPPQAPDLRALSRDAFALLGESRVAYVRAMRSEAVGFLCPEAPMLAPGYEVFVLHAADGAPILITDSRDDALAAAHGNQLETVSLH
jgi:hypothetical protein